MSNQHEAIKEVTGRHLLSTEAASEFLGMSSHWLKAARFRPELAGPIFCKLGRTVRYDTQDLEVWLEERKFRGTHEIPSKEKGESS